MKYFSKYSVMLIAAALVLGSCKKLTEGLDIAPNSPTTAPYPLVLNGAEVSGILVYEGNLARVAGIFSRSFSGADRQYAALNSYSTTATDYNDTWDNLYANVISQHKIVETAALAVNDKKTAGIAEVNMAMGFGLAADLWGDVPFSQVGDPVKYPTPIFDSQASVYAGIQTLLTTAIANMGGVGVGPGSKDFYFAGSTASWIKVAYTLKARYYLHTRDYANAITNAKLGISSAAGDLLDPHGSSYLQDFNVYYSFLSYDRVGYLNADAAYAPKYLDPTSSVYKGNIKTNETARFEYYYQTGLNTSGLDPNVLVDFDWGNPTNQNGFFGATTSFPLVTYAENNLILAEAYLKQATPDINNALASLNAHRAYLTAGGGTNSGYVADGHLYAPYIATDFLPGGIVNPITGGLTQNQALLTEVLKERYVSLIGQIEQFTDVRRTGNYLKIPTSSSTTTILPQRFFYAQDEINTNPNTPKQVTADLFKPTPVNTTAY